MKVNVYRKSLISCSISAPSYTMYEDVKSSQVSTIRKPDIRTEVDTQEYKTERTIKLSGKTDGKISDTVEISPGDKVLVPRPFQPGRAAPPPSKQEPLIDPRMQQKPQSMPTQKTPSPGVRPIVEEPVQRYVCWLI